MKTFAMLVTAAFLLILAICAMIIVGAGTP